MKKLFVFTFLAVATLGLAGCMKMDCGCDPKPKHQPPILFQYEYVNYAWGFRHHGFLIDEHGNVKGFKQPTNWAQPDSSGMMGKIDLEYNLAQCDTVCGRVEEDALRENFEKIEDVRRGNIVDNGLVMADAGTGVLSAWYWNEDAGKYESVFLISNGDVYKVNTHREVKEIVDWLKKIGEHSNRFYWFGSN